MQITYYSEHDLLYIRLISEDKPVRNERFDEDIVFDLDGDDRIVGIEILDASTRVKLAELLPIKTEVLQVA